MKSLQEHLNEALDLKRNSLEREMKSIFSNDIMRSGITLDEIIGFASDALKSSRLKVRDIQNEINQFDDPDDLFNAVDRNELPDYANFMNAMYYTISKSKYIDDCDDIVDQLTAAPEFVFDIVELAK